MATYPQHNSKPHFLPLIILVVFCLLFLILFRVDTPPVNDEGQITELDLFHMLPDSRINNPAVKRQARKDGLDLRELAARDSFDDPTLMAFPNKKYGFSVVRQENNEPPLPSIDVYHLPILEIAEPESARQPLVGVFPEPDVSDPDSFKKPEIPAIDFDEPNKKYSPRIIWLENGIERAAPFKIIDIEKMAAGKIPTSVTEINIEKLPSGPVQFLTRKSGVSALDNLVMRHVRELFAKVFTGDLQAAQLPDIIIADWRLILREDKNP